MRVGFRKNTFWNNTMSVVSAKSFGITVFVVPDLYLIPRRRVMRILRNGTTSPIKSQRTSNAMMMCKLSHKH